MNAKNLLGGFIVGAALGAAAGLLLAPASGEKTRKKIAKGSMRVKKNVVDYVETSMDGLRSQINKRLDQVSGKVKETLANGAESVATKVRNNG